LPTLAKVKKGESYGSLTPVAARILDRLCLAILTLTLISALVLFGGSRTWFILPAISAIYIAAAIYFIRRIFWGRLDFSFCSPLAFFILFLLYATVQLFFNAPVFYTGRNECLTLLAYFLSIVMLIDLFREGDRGFNLLLLLILCVGLLSGYALILHFKELNYVLWLDRPSQYGMRASATFICPNHFAHAAAMALILSVSLLSISRMSMAFKLIVGYSVLLSVLPLVLTQSRSGLLGFASGISLTVLLISAQRGKRRLIYGLVSLLLLAGVAASAIWFIFPAFKRRIIQAFHGDIRLQIWPDTLNMISEKPLFGYGPGSYTYSFAPFRNLLSQSDLYLRYAHNEYLHVIAEYGLLGLILLMAAWAVLTTKMYRVYKDGSSAKDRILAAGVLGVIFCSLVHAVFDFQFHMFANCMILIVAVSALLGRSARREKRRELSVNHSKIISGLSFILCLILGLYCSSLAYAEMLRLQGEAAKIETDPTAPLELYKKTQTLDPMHPAAYLEQGLHSLSRGFWARNAEGKDRFMLEAEQYFNQTLLLNPFELKALWGKAQLAERRGHSDEAEAILLKIIKLDPYYSYYHMQYGLLLKRQGRTEEALTQLYRALKMDPDNEVVKLNIQQIQKGNR